MKLRTTLSLALAIWSASVSVPAWGAECSSASALRAGDPAPCNGVLTPSVWTARCLRCLRVDLPACHAEATGAAGLAKADLVACRGGRRASEQLAEERRRLLLEVTGAIEPAPAPWWRSPWLVGGVAFALGGVAGWRIAR